MSALSWVYDDGGREAAGFRGETGDCVVRAIAIAAGKPYREVYEAAAGYLRERADACGLDARHRTPRNGMPSFLIRAYLEVDLGWSRHPTMGIGTGCRVHLAHGELPTGRIIAKVSKHTTAVIDGVVHDTYDPTREGTRCVYLYWAPPEVTP